ncbi:MAG: hypothetical protein QOH93_1857 [Chloroflexia bacterium]|jgi:hypothetical protein|nr:hypothetical protein [Chloroflexia bacterium]
MLDTTSRKIGTGNVSRYETLRWGQDMLFTWSVSITPLIAKPPGMDTSNGYPLARLVIGQTSANPTFEL